MFVKEIHRRLQELGNKGRAIELQRFFKTGPGEYGEGDVFLGIRVPELRKLAKTYPHITIKEAGQILNSSIHEQRLLALFILVRKYLRGNEIQRKAIYDLYLKNTRFVNNWDLVDGSAGHIVGAFLMGKDKKPLYRLSKSKNLWERRISIMATFHFIKQDQFSETFTIAKTLLADEEDLIHKAVGWMLREVGKRHMPAEEKFLKEHYRKMPRTMLRYAIERFPETKRQMYLKSKI
jgi:3-methyladenine DNA glycosylase AlkD